MNSYLDLVKEYNRIHKKDHKATILCITIAVCLVTAIFSMANVGISAQKVQAIKNFGDYHIAINNPTAYAIATISKRTDIATQGRAQEIDDDTFQGKQAFYLAWDTSIIQQLTNLTNIKVSKGRFPERENEIALDETTLKNSNWDIGDSVQVKELNNSSYTIVGSFPSTQKEVQATGNTLAFISINDMTKLGKTPDPDRYFIKFKDNASIKNAIKDIQRTCNISDEDYLHNTALLAATGVAVNSSALKFYAAATFLLLLVLAASCIMIANSINLNIMNRTKFFGLLRCLGASKKQIKRMVMTESIQLCFVGIPIGLISGYLLTLTATAVLKYRITDYTEIPLFQFSLLAICMGIVVGVASVLLSSRVPAKKASEVSPVIAVTGAVSIKEKEIKKEINTKSLPIDVSMGIHHATSNKKSLILMSFSLALSIILFLGFSVFTQMASIGFKAMRPNTADITVTDQKSSNEITQKTIKKIEKISGIKRVYGRMEATFSTNGQKDMQLVSYEKNQFSWAKNNLLSGEINENSLNSTFTALAYKISGLSVGDKIELMTANGYETITVAGLLSGTPASASENCLIVSENIFKNLTAKSTYSDVDIQLKNAVSSDSVVASIRAMVSSDISLSDNTQSNVNARNMYYTFVIFIYGFLLVITLISLINISNSMNISVTSRTNYYGVMRAVGISVKQLKRMVISEAIVYAGFGCVTGCIIGTFLHRMIYISFITDSYQMEWKAPVALLITIIAITVLMIVISVLGPIKRISNMDIVEAVNAQ